MGGVLVAGPERADVVGGAYAVTLQSRRRYALLPALTDGPAGDLLAERVPQARLAELRSWAQVLVEHRRGSATLLHDHERLHRVHDSGRVAVVGTDEPRVAAAFPADWLRVLLRGPHLPRAWASGAWTLVIRTDLLPPAAAAPVIHTADLSRPDPTC